MCMVVCVYYGVEYKWYGIEFVCVVWLVYVYGRGMLCACEYYAV